MRTAGGPRTPVSENNEVDENDKQKIVQGTAQETEQELRDRLGLHGDVPIPAPLNIPTKKIPKPMLVRVATCEHDVGGAQATAAEQTTATPRLPMTSITPGQYSSRLQRYKGKPRAPGKPQVKPQAKPQPTQAIPAKNQEDIFMTPPMRSSSLHAAAPASACLTQPPTSASSYTKNCIQAYQQPSRILRDNSPLLGRLGKELPELPELPDQLDQLDLPDLPRHLRPENQYSPRRYADARAHISFASTAKKHNYQTGEVLETPVKLPRRHNISDHQHVGDQQPAHYGVVIVSVATAQARSPVATGAETP
ncbi:hypothetical protein ONZ43_g7715 [Nemania bipapillata]|uniref:Uncharacterized protein n=1 Tax=Nemania bipapillata TaxID=110536 RepID=A0ACC2HPG1_9PEZI|nr:hypothetical protein ONZ43_g7715 [Nemania bipapillata]